MVTVAAGTVTADHFFVVPFVTLGAIGFITMSFMALVTSHLGMGATHFGEKLFRFAVTSSTAIGSQTLGCFSRRWIMGIVAAETIFLDFTAGVTVVTVEAVRDLTMLWMALVTTQILRMN